jgi:hypothetical protein
MTSIFRTALAAAAAMLMLPLAAAAATSPSNGSSSGAPSAASPSHNFGSASSGRTSQSTPATRPPTYSERYGMLADHNIFVRDRTRIPHGGSGGYGGGSSSTQPSTRPTVRSPEEALALRGVVIEEGVLHAYVEDTNSYQMMRLGPGDPVARGRISAIDIDAVQYESNGHRAWIEIGQDFTGHPAAAGSSFVAGSPGGATTGPSGPPIDPNDPNLTLEQRMKLRRMQGH